MTATATKTSVKVCLRGFKLHRVYAISFNSSNVGEFVWSWDSKGPYQSSGEAKEGRCLVFTSSKNTWHSALPRLPLGTSTPSIRHFHVVVAQRRQGNAQKKVMDVQVCCFTNLNLLFLFLPLSLPSPSRRMSIGNLRWRRFRGDGDRTGRESLELRQPSLPVKNRTLRSQWTQEDGAFN